MNEMLRKVVREAVRDGINEALIRHGIDTADVAAMQADMAYLRKSRLGADEVIKWMRRSALTALCSGLLLAVWEGMRHLAKGS